MCIAVELPCRGRVRDPVVGAFLRLPGAVVGRRAFAAVACPRDDATSSLRVDPLARLLGDLIRGAGDAALSAAFDGVLPARLLEDAVRGGLARPDADLGSVRAGGSQDMYSGASGSVVLPDHAAEDAVADGLSEEDSPPLPHRLRRRFLRALFPSLGRRFRCRLPGRLLLGLEAAGAGLRRREEEPRELTLPDGVTTGHEPAAERKESACERSEPEAVASVLSGGDWRFDVSTTALPRGRGVRRTCMSFDSALMAISRSDGSSSSEMERAIVAWAKRARSTGFGGAAVDGESGKPARGSTAAIVPGIEGCCVASKLVFV